MEHQRTTRTAAECAARAERRRRKKILHRRRKIALIIGAAFVFALGIGGTIAFLTTNTDPIANEFTPSRVTCAVTETFADNVKSNVSIKNTGDTAAYIRAMVVATWQNESGEILSVVPVPGTAYSIRFAENTAWEKRSDGCYYFNAPVAPGENTDILIASCQPLMDAPEAGYTLHVEIIAAAIQSEPSTVAENAWGFRPHATSQG